MDEETKEREETEDEDKFSEQLTLWRMEYMRLVQG